MYTQKLLVYEGSKRKTVKCFHTRIIYLFRIFDSTYQKRKNKGRELKFIIHEKGYIPVDYEATPKPFVPGKFENTIIFVKIFLKSCG